MRNEFYRRKIAIFRKYYLRCVISNLNQDRNQDKFSVQFQIMSKYNKQMDYLYKLFCAIYIF